MEGEKQMNYAYDVLLNFTDGDRLIEFYEWNDKDYIENIKIIPIFYILKEDLINFFNNNIKINKKFLLNIRNKTVSYNQYGDLEYCSIFSDGSRAIAIEFNSEGESIARSTLLIDEERDIIDETMDNNFIKIDYRIVSKDKNDFTTREESLRKKYLLIELNKIKEQQEVEKLDFLYTEVFKKDKISFNKRINKLIAKVNNDFDDKCRHLYDTMKLIHATKNRL